MQWHVDFTDDENQEVQTADFKTKQDAQVWIKNQEIQNRYDPTGFEVVDGPYLYKRSEVDYVDYGAENPIVLDRTVQTDYETSFSAAPDLIDYIIENGLDNKVAIDIAATSLKDEPNLQLLEWLEDNNIEDVVILVHGNFKPLVDKMKKIADANGWKFKASAIYEDDVDRCDLSEDDKSEKKVDKKDSIVAALKKASKEFQKSASNYDPEKFAKIVVAFDDLAAGVGSYDFKKKRKFN